MINSLAICGHGRHGKDTAAKIIAYYTKLRYVNSTSWFVAKKFYDVLLVPSSQWYQRLASEDEVLAKVFNGDFARAYQSVESWFNSRHLHRKLWADFIDFYNQPTGYRLYEDCLKEQDILTGLRFPHEFNACVNAGLFTASLWVKQPGAPEEATQLVKEEDCDFTIINEKDKLRATEHRVRRLLSFFGLGKLRPLMPLSELYG